MSATSPGSTARRPRISPRTGRRFFSTEAIEGGGGTGVVYVRKTDGSPPVRLGEGYALALSPDKRSALATPMSFSQLILLPTGAGQARRLERGPIESYQSARFLPDGKRILFAGSEKGRRARLYVQDLAGGAPRPVTAEGAGAGFHGVVVSPDGRFATGPAPGSGFARYPLEGGSPLPIEGLAEGEFPVQWTADGRSLFVYRIGDVPARIFRLDLSTGRRELWKELIPPDLAGANVIPDGPDHAGRKGLRLLLRSGSLGPVSGRRAQIDDDARTVASACEGSAPLRRPRPARPDVGWTERLIPRRAAAPAARTSSLPSVGRRFAPRTHARVLQK